MSTFVVAALMMAAVIGIQFFFPTALSSIMTGLSYGSVKAILDTWTANRKERKAARKKARQDRKEARKFDDGGIFKLRPVEGIRWIGNGREAKPATSPAAPDPVPADGDPKTSEPAPATPGTDIKPASPVSQAPTEPTTRAEAGQARRAARQNRRAR